VVVRPERLVARFPKLYHMAHDGSWPSIANHGLLSTSALLDLYQLSGAARHAVESEWRPESVPLHLAGASEAVVRDQKPLRPDLLGRCLTDGMTPSEWYELLNGRVFFWLTEENLNVLLHARAYRDQAQTVLTVDTAALLARHLPETELSSINSGSILRGGALRGARTFSSIQDHPTTRVVELAVLRAVPDIAELVIRVERRHPDGSRDLLLRQGSGAGSD
jgi:hypothetical protein